MPVSRVVYAVAVVVRDGVELGRVTLTGARVPDLALVNRLARMRLTAGRARASLELRSVAPGLADLLELVGLADALGVEVEGQAEGLEQPRVEEVVVTDDPIA